MVSYLIVALVCFVAGFVTADAASWLRNKL